MRVKKTDMAQSMDLLKQLQTAVLGTIRKCILILILMPFRTKNIEANSILCHICFVVAVILCTAFFVQNL
jgi:hypothetical protein